MGVIGRGVIFAVGTVANGVLFILHSRIVLTLIGYAPPGPATGALNLLPGAMQLTIGGLQAGLVLYFIGGLGEERSVDARRPQP